MSRGSWQILGCHDTKFLSRPSEQGQRSPLPGREAHFSGGTLAGSAEVAAIPVPSRMPVMNSLKGQLLVATTQLLDPNFARTVVLILEHNDEGAVGVILNRPTQARVTDLAGQGFEESTD